MCFDVLSPTDRFESSTGYETLDQIPLNEGELVILDFFFLSQQAKHFFPHLHHDECVLTIMVTGCHVGGIPFCDCCEAIMVQSLRQENNMCRLECPTKSLYATLTSHAQFE